MMGVNDLLGSGGPNLEVEPPFLVSALLAWQVTSDSLASVFLDTLVDGEGGGAGRAKHGGPGREWGGEGR